MLNLLRVRRSLAAIGTVLRAADTRVVSTFAVSRTSSDTVSSLNLLIAVKFGQIVFKVSLILRCYVTSLQTCHASHV